MEIGKQHRQSTKGRTLYATTERCCSGFASGTAYRLRVTDQPAVIVELSNDADKPLEMATVFPNDGSSLIMRNQSRELVLWVRFNAKKCAHPTIKGKQAIRLIENIGRKMGAEPKPGIVPLQELPVSLSIEIDNKSPFEAISRRLAETPVYSDYSTFENLKSFRNSPKAKRMFARICDHYSSTESLASDRILIESVLYGESYIQLGIKKDELIFMRGQQEAFSINLPEVKITREGRGIHLTGLMELNGVGVKALHIHLPTIEKALTLFSILEPKTHLWPEPELDPTAGDDDVHVQGWIAKDRLITGRAECRLTDSSLILRREGAEIAFNLKDKELCLQTKSIPIVLFDSKKRIGPLAIYPLGSGLLRALTREQHLHHDTRQLGPWILFDEMNRPLVCRIQKENLFSYGPGALTAIELQKEGQPVFKPGPGSANQGAVALPTGRRILKGDLATLESFSTQIRQKQIQHASPEALMLAWRELERDFALYLSFGPLLDQYEKHKTLIGKTMDNYRIEELSIGELSQIAAIDLDSLITHGFQVKIRLADHLISQNNRLGTKSGSTAFIWTTSEKQNLRQTFLNCNEFNSELTSLANLISNIAPQSKSKACSHMASIFKTQLPPQNPSQTQNRNQLLDANRQWLRLVFGIAPTLAFAIDRAITTIQQDVEKRINVTENTKIMACIGERTAFLQTFFNFPESSSLDPLRKDVVFQIKQLKYTRSDWFKGY